MRGEPPAVRHGADVERQLAVLCPQAASSTIASLAADASHITFRRHERITTPDDGPRLVLLLDGHAGSLRSDAEGRTRLIALNGPGELAGLTSLAATGGTAEVVGLTDGRAAVWDRAAILAAAHRDGGFAADLLELALHASARLLTRLDHVSFDSVTQRLARLLWQRRDLLFDPERPLLSRPELADLAGASREMTDRAIRSLEARGLVRRVGTTGLVLADPDGLLAMADVDADERECS